MSHAGSDALRNIKSVLVRMLNDHQDSWDVTDERVSSLAFVRPSLPVGLGVVIDKMLDDFESGRWTKLSERYAAISAAINLDQKEGIARDVSRQVKIGASKDGVADRKWVADVIAFLDSLSPPQSDPDE